MLNYFQRKPRFSEKPNVSIIGDQPSSLPSSSDTQPEPICTNKVFNKGAYLESDPAKRDQILDYHPNDQEEVRRAYLVKGPCRPNLKEYPTTNLGGRDRSFHNSWYEEYDWLEYSIERDAVFCLPCYVCYKGSSNPAFVKEGFKGWNLKHKLNKHVGDKPNSHHKKCVKACEDLMKKNQCIEYSYAKYSTKEEADYLVRLKASLEAVKFLVRGGLAFRGHNEGEGSFYKGHFLEFIEALGRNSEKIAGAITSGGGNSKMTSPQIQKELANACAVETIKKIVGEIEDGFFCVLVDESGDCSGKEQMAVVVRFVDYRGFVVERFIGIVHVEDTSAIALKGALETLLLGFGLCISRIRGQGYDGASNMRGQFGGLKALIQNENPQAYYVHCFAHQLQLALISMARKNEDVDWFFCEVTRIVNFLRSSNKRQALLRKKQVAHFANLIENELVESGTGLNQELSIARAGDTRWGSHFRTLSRLVDLFTPIIEVFEDLKSDRASKGEPQSLLIVMQTFGFIFMLHLMVEVLSLTNDLSEALQKGDQDIVNAMELVEVSKKKFQKMRDSGWEAFYEQVVASCGNVEIDVPDMKSRYVKANKSKRLAPFVTNFDYFKNDCFLHVIDFVLKELNDRFTPENTELLNCVASLSPCSSFEAFDTKSLVRLARLYPNDFEDVTDKELSSQFETYIECVKMDDNFSNLKGISDLCRTLVRTKKHKTFRFVYILVKLALTLPVATASVERVFSGMKYVKNELRNRMANPWLNDCLVTFVEKEVFSTINDRDIIKRFQGMSKRRMHLRLD
ncbi:zinc finger MYM-type protein 1-like [Asparagus officinalis]|uniref:zinc finger MYM-type protein 1-like n=1 Tax=Asparagus officinalis TaxID=4686 RepID=UPI00098E60D5|nr:zinc finger MYM-type protein 1-like [Asparagus officinalis]XP_020246203.1 zinc finger MYM-type protein 1-like [Asparagus officinalis]XP_020248138.1 zinc finger MYM-type protein 1-like [Asparagus officinalis]XP_020271848.1 zinc finger MYM-type protein 1-like [Asparagus officinalis]